MMDTGIFPVSPCGSTKWQSSIQPVRFSHTDLATNEMQQISYVKATAGDVESFIALQERSTDRKLLGSD